MKKKSAAEVIEKAERSLAAVNAEIAKALIEDVYVTLVHPEERSVRAIRTGPDVTLYSTNREAVRAIQEALASGAKVHGTTLTAPTSEQLRGLLGEPAAEESTQRIAGRRTFSSEEYKLHAPTPTTDARPYWFRVVDDAGAEIHRSRAFRLWSEARDAAHAWAERHGDSGRVLVIHRGTERAPNYGAQLRRARLRWHIEA